MATHLIPRHDPLWRRRRWRRHSPLQAELRRAMTDLLGDKDAWGPDEAGAWAPALDVEETDEAFVAHVELPGIDPADIEVTLDDDVLTIAGERRFYDERDEDDFHRVERRYGRFRRAVRLPAQVDAEQVAATADGGLLEITLPKAEQTRAKRIDVESG